MDADSNRSCNSYRNFSTVDRILKLVDDSEIELTPKQISEETGINHNTVRIYLRRLLAKNKLVQPYPGAYCNKITYGVRFVPLAVHNVRLLVSDLGVVEHWEKTEVVGGVKLYVCFGVERRQITGFLACDLGMSREACLLALNRWFDIVEGRRGKPVEELIVQSVEFNKDYVGLRLDGVSCMTKTGLFNTLERIYQKEENVVRHEHKVSKSMSVTEFQSLIQGGVTGYNVNQQFFMLMQKMDKLTDAYKFLNSQVLTLTRLFEADFKRKWKSGE